MAFYDYTDPALAGDAVPVILSAFGGLMLLASGWLFLFILIRGHFAPRADAGPYRFSRAAHLPVTVPAALNGFGLWLPLMIALTVINYGFPIFHEIARGGEVPAVYVGSP
jgi:cytochrome c oxidase subunit 1